MHDDRAILNRFLVDVFNEILRTEEKSIAESGYDNLSIRELHVIEAVCLCTECKKNTATDIAAFLGVVPGTLTTAASILEKKGYVSRIKDEADKRVVRIAVTPKGEKANADHTRFHEQIIDSVLDCLTPAEAVVFVRGLSAVSGFFRTQNAKGQKV